MPLSVRTYKGELPLQIECHGRRRVVEEDGRADWLGGGLLGWREKTGHGRILIGKQRNRLGNVAVRAVAKLCGSLVWGIGRR